MRTRSRMLPDRKKLPVSRIDAWLPEFNHRLFAVLLVLLGAIGFGLALIDAHPLRLALFGIVLARGTLNLIRIVRRHGSRRDAETIGDISVDRR